MSSLALCIPAFNAAEYIPRLLNSAIKQIIPFDEILVYNDASSDNTADIVKQFGVTLIQGDVNVGCSIGKNKLAGIAKSDWLHFHDADDLLLPNFTAVAHHWMAKENAADIILMHYNYRNFKTNELLGQPYYSVDDLKADSVKFSITNKIVNFAVIRKSSFLKIGGFDTDAEVLYNEDRAFYTKAAINKLSFDYEPELTCINYFYPNSMSAKNVAKCAQAALNVWTKVFGKTANKYNAEIAAQLLQNATYAGTANAWKIAKDSIKTARAIFPNQIPQGSKYFRLLYKLLPFQAYFLREIIIRYFTTKRKKIKNK